MALAIVLGGTVPALAAPPPEASDSPIVVVRGEVVETACYVMAGRRGESHRQCAISCARAGQPLGIVDEASRTLLFLVLDHRGGEPTNPLLDSIASRVEVRGHRLQRGGINAIVVDQVKDLGPPRK
jgi:hypothetical protein